MAIKATTPYVISAGRAFLPDLHNAYPITINPAKGPSMRTDVVTPNRIAAGAMESRKRKAEGSLRQNQIRIKAERTKKADRALRNNTKYF
jgi:hypothetical protein